MKPRIRINQYGWVRHDGEGLPTWLPSDAPIWAVCRSGSTWAMRGLPANAYRGWKHVEMSGDILHFKIVEAA